MPNTALYNKSGKYPWKIVKKAFQDGLVDAAMLEDYDGVEMGALNSLIIGEGLISSIDSYLSVQLNG